MTEEKDNKIAAKLRTDGNMLFQQSKFYDALVAYNKSLCFADPSSENIALAYANRSAVYLEVNQHQKCLENIKLAQEQGYKDVKKLKERGDRCQKLMMEYKSDPNDNPWTFFKLSFPAHEKIPFMANCLELRENEEYGRHIITNRQLNPGDIVLIEEPFMKNIESSARYIRCSHCLKSNLLSLLPCSKCTKTMFCSRSCCDEANERYHKLECCFIKELSIDQLGIAKRHTKVFRLVLEALSICEGKFEKLRAVLDGPQNITGFDLDYNDHVTDLELLKVIRSLHPHKLKEVDEKWLADFVLQNSIQEICESQYEKDVFFDAAKVFFLVNAANNYSIGFKKYNDSVPNIVGSGLFTVGTYFNHSCAPNVSRIGVDNKLVFIVNRVIKSGGMIFVTYGPEFMYIPQDERRQYLEKFYDFKCNCEACAGKYPLISGMKRYDYGFNCMNFNDIYGKAAQYAFKEGNNYIRKHNRHFPGLEICMRMAYNMRLLNLMARLAPFYY